MNPSQFSLLRFQMYKDKEQYILRGYTIESECGDTKNLNETESKTFSDTKYFRYRIRYFFSIPNFFDTESDTIQKIGKVSKP